MIVIDDIITYEDRGLSRTQYHWHDERGSGVADNRCVVTGELLGDTPEQCIAHCQLYGQFSARFDFFVNNLLKSVRFDVDAHRAYLDHQITEWIQANSIYPQSTLEM